MSRARRGERGDRHSWTRLETYLKVHQSYLDDLQAYGEVIENGIVFVEDEPGKPFFGGRLVCRHELFVDVQKTLGVNASGYVRTDRYSYHAGVIGPVDRPVDRPVFRYDNAHAYTIEGHADAHHRHRFDHLTWREIEPPEWVGHDRWPHLDEAVRELMAWWETIGRRLDLGR